MKVFQLSIFGFLFSAPSLTVIRLPTDNFFIMATPVKFLIETKEELQKVTWPSRTEVTKLTIIVLTLSLIVGIYIGGIDLIFTKLLETILK